MDRYDIDEVEDEEEEEDELLTEEFADSGYSSLDEDHEPDVVLNEIAVEKAGSAPIGWFIGDPFPNFSTLAVAEVMNLCRRFKVNRRTGQVLLNFRTDSPLWPIRCAFAGYYKSLFPELESLLQHLAKTI